MKIHILFRFKYPNLIVILLMSLTVVACNNFLDVNTDPDSPSESAVSENVLLPGIEGAISFNLVGGYPARYPNYWIGQLSSSADAPTAETFNIFPADVNNTWTYDIYTNSLKNDILLMNLAEQNKNYQYLGISKVLAAQILAVTTDLWGDIPWTEAFKFPDITKPKFDSQQSIYKEIFRLINEGIADLQNTTSQKRTPRSDDLLYQGQKNSWIKFAYTLKARYSLRLTYAPGTTGVAQADSALNALSEGFGSNADDADFQYYNKTGNENPWYQWGIKWTTAYANTFMLNLMNKNADPRIKLYLSPAENDGSYVGHRNGNAINPAGSVSVVVGTDKNGNDLLNYITQESPLSWITFAEAEFIAAEAYAWKSDYVNAKKALDAAITANLSKNGFPSDTISAFLSRLGALPTSFEAAQQMIIEQKYIADFLSLENWNDYRRTGYPGVSASDTDNPSHTNIPLRFMYSSDVLLDNAENMPTVDWLKDRLWWDGKNK